MKRLILTLALAATALAVAACSPASGAPSPAPSDAPGQPSAAPGDAITIASKDLKFDRAELVVPAGEAFTLRFDNQEAPPHNVAIYDAAGAPVFVGEIFSGTASRDYAVPAIAAGSYSFRCDVHPDMKGTVVAQ